MHVHRRRLAIAAGALLASPLFASAQTPGKVYRLGLLGAYSASPAFEAVYGQFREGMAELGWIEGKHYVLVARWAQGDLGRLPALAAELVGLSPDALMAGTAETAHPLKNATRTIPIVAIAIPDPVEVGLAKSLARPGENMTGPIYAFSELTTKQLEVLKETIPQASAVAALVHAASLTRVSSMERAEAAATLLGIRLQSVAVLTAEHFEPAFKDIRASGADAVLIVASPFTFVHRSRLAELALRYGLPTVWNNPAATEAGGLVSYGPDIGAMWRRAAVYMDKILRGAKAGDLPFERPTKFHLVINLRSAKALGLSIPQSMLARADRVIE